MLAGGVAFTLMSLGFALVAIPLTIALVGAFFGTLFSWIARNNPEDLPLDGAPLPGNIDQIVSGAWSVALPWLIGLVILGIILWVVGYLFSLRTLKSHRVNRPVAVTWSALGIAVAANFLLSALSSPFSGLLNMWTPNVNGTGNVDGDGGFRGLEGIDFTPFIGLGVFFILVNLLVNAAIGLLSWWWMAHAFREPSAPIGGQAAVPPSTI